MCTGGRIVDHLKHGLEDPKNDIFFVGYQTKGTPGRRMIEKQTPVKAGIHTLTGYSAHADQLSPCGSAHACQLGKIHASAARTNPPRPWGITCASSPDQSTWIAE